MIKKVVFMSAFVLSIMTFSNLSANCNQDCNPPACPCDEKVGECYCKYVRYKQKCHYTTRCEEEQIACPRTCCRMVPEQYEVERCRYRTENYCVPVEKCRMVPEKYCVQVEKCRMVPEKYFVEVEKCRMVPEKYTIQVPKCRQVPEYYKETKCRYRPEYYQVQQYKTRKKYIREPHYTCVPEYYWQYECDDSCR